MVEFLAGGLGILASGPVIVALVMGILVGTVVGFLPGIGLMVAFALSLPFVYGADPVLAMAFLMGLYAQATIAGDLTAVTFAVPGTPASAALVLDGYPMAKRGEVGQAIGAALASSGIGAMIGIIPLLFLVPVARPIVLAMGSPEVFSLTVLGVSVVAVVSGRSVWRGLGAGALGFLLACFGPETQFGIIRFGFGNYYLLDGIPIIPLAIGLFAIPEVIDLHGSGSSIVRDGVLRARWSDILEGMRRPFRHLGLVLRCSLIGTAGGFIPGLGATVSQWVAYGHAMQSAKDSSQFGKGDVRGVIGPASANNSKDGGELIPTIALAVPGSPPMALILAALIMLGFAPGPEMLGRNIDFTYFLLIALVVANLVGVLVSALVGRGLGKLLSLSGGYMVPLIVLFLFIGAAASSGRFGDIVVLLVIGAMAWAMRLYGWSVVTLTLGFVLGSRAEQLLWRSSAAYGFDFVLRPGVLVILAIGAVIAASPYLLQWWRSRRGGGLVIESADEPPPRTRGSLAFSLGIAALGLTCAAVATFSGWPTPAALFPTAFGLLTALIALAVAARDATVLFGRHPRDGEAAATGAVADAEQQRLVTRRRQMMGVLLAIGAAVWALGLTITLGGFAALYLRWQARTSWLICVVAGLVVSLSIHFGMMELLNVRLPVGLLGIGG